MNGGNIDDYLGKSYHINIGRMTLEVVKFLWELAKYLFWGTFIEDLLHWCLEILKKAQKKASNLIKIEALPNFK